MTTAPSILDTVERLVDARPLDPQKVGEILGITLQRNPAADTAAITCWVQPAAAGSYEAVDLRMPDPDVGDDKVFLSVTTRGDGGVDQSAIIQRFGSDFVSEPPSPRYKPGVMPAYLTYEKDWGELSFGVTVGTGRLVRFIVEMKL